LSDILLLGTHEQVYLATQVIQELVAGRQVETSALVVSLRDFIRSVLDLEPVPEIVGSLRQGPARAGASGGGGGRKEGGGNGSGRGGGGGGGGGGMGGGMGAGGLGLGLGLSISDDGSTTEQDR